MSFKNCVAERFAKVRWQIGTLLYTVVETIENKGQCNLIESQRGRFTNPVCNTCTEREYVNFSYNIAFFHFFFQYSRNKVIIHHPFSPLN